MKADVGGNITAHSQAMGPRPEASEQLRKLATVRLFVLSRLASRYSEAKYARVFGLRATEARMLLVLRSCEPSTLERVSREMSLEKGLASRSAASLVKRGLVDRRIDRRDGRAVELSLTGSGREISANISAEVLRWNEDWLSILTKAERDTFLRCLDKLIAKTPREGASTEQNAAAVPQR